MEIIKMNKPIGYTTILPDELMVLNYNDELVPMIMCKDDEVENILSQITEIEDPTLTPADIYDWLMRQQEPINELEEEIEGDDG